MLCRTNQKRRLLCGGGLRQACDWLTLHTKLAHQSHTTGKIYGPCRVSDTVTSESRRAACRARRIWCAIGIQVVYRVSWQSLQLMNMQSAKPPPDKLDTAVHESDIARHVWFGLHYHQNHDVGSLEVAGHIASQGQSPPRTRICP